MSKSISISIFILAKKKKKKVQVQLGKCISSSSPGDDHQSLSRWNEGDEIRANSKPLTFG